MGNQWLSWRAARHRAVRLRPAPLPAARSPGRDPTGSPILLDPVALCSAPSSAPHQHCSRFPLRNQEASLTCGQGWKERGHLTSGARLRCSDPSCRVRRHPRCSGFGDSRDSLSSPSSGFPKRHVCLFDGPSLTLLAKLVTQTILLPQSSKCWNYRPGSASLAGVTSLQTKQEG